jgi:allantoinase
MIGLCRETRCPVHIVHLSAAAEAKSLIKKAKAEGLPFTVETFPHYLTFAAGEFVGADTRYKCAPPIRTEDQQGHLRAMLSMGLIDTLGSDHSPAPPTLKHYEDGNLRHAWGGIASLQLLLPCTWTSVGEQLRPVRLVELLTRRPAQLSGVADSKGSIAAGRDADFVVFDPGIDFTVDSQMLRHRHKLTPYMGRRLRGMVEATVLRGRPAFVLGQYLSSPRGQLLCRHDSAKRR